MPFFGSTLNVGAMVEPLAPQTAEFLGVSSGILVKQVARKSEAAAAGLKPKDVILKVGNEAIGTTADWDRALRSNQGKPVQVTILRDGKQLAVNLQVDSKHTRARSISRTFSRACCRTGLVRCWRNWIRPSNRTGERMRPAAAEELRQPGRAVPERASMPTISESTQTNGRAQQRDGAVPAEFKADDFRIDPKQMEELKRQMEEMRKSMPELFQFNKQQLEQFRHEMQQMKLEFGQHV